LSDFYAEGCAVGDINGDGKADIAYGPFWFAGPDFEKPNRFTDGEAFVAEKGYSDNFFSYIVDATKDGANDILVYGFPGKEARLYVNPGKGKQLGENWAMLIVANEISNESPTFADIIPGGLPEMVATNETRYGYYQAGEDATQPWTFHAISKGKEAGGRFEHGMGVGDVNGDGRMDIIQRQYWYEQPAEVKEGTLWQKHGWAPMASAGGAQILVDDVDGDGDNDIISSLKAHGYGLAWFEQVEPGKFARHDIMGESSTDSPYGVCFSQLHALALADVDGDGRNDFVTGKRYLAHQGHDPGGLMDPVLYWFRNTKTKDGGIEFVPHFVDNDSGVGVEVTVADLNGDGKPDIVSGNKKGLAIHVQAAGAKHTAVPKWNAGQHLPQDQYGFDLSPEEARERATAPPGFSIDLIASEPDLVQPIAMCFDARGRIWVIEGNTYPVRREGGWNEGADRILIFEDTDADGSFETRKVFAENINLASGLEVGFGGVYVGAAPYLLFFPDKDQDDLPDSDPEILLDGWAWQDTHETLNAFTWGPDGWLYGCHGVFTHSNVGKPGTPDEERQPINAGLWRFHPVSKKFEVYAHGTSNPWGVDFNEYGDLFVSACVIPHFYHLSDGGRYFRQAGQHFNPYTFDDIKTIADHSHYTGDMRILWAERRGDNPNDTDEAKNFTNNVGGGHAHCGLLYYDAPEFPAPFRRQMYFHNLHGHRMVSETLVGDGSGYVAQHLPDFILSNNHETIGVGVMQGPDGAIYYSDWADKQTCHHRDVEIWDRTNGRILRVRHGEVKSTVTKLPEMSDVELVSELGNENSFHARQAQRLLQERKTAGSLDTEATDKALVAFEKEHAADPPLMLRALWTRFVTDQLSPELIATRLDDPSEHVRGWAVQLLGADKEAIPGDALTQLEKMATEDFSLVVRRYLASKLQRLPLEQRWKIAEGLISHPRSLHDRNIPLLCWYGIEPLVEADPMRALSLANRSVFPELKEFITRRATMTPGGRSALMTSLSQAKKPEIFLATGNQLLESLANLPPVDRPDGWDSARQNGEALAKNNPAITDVLFRLGARFGDASAFPHWRDIATDAKAGLVDRATALDLLAIGNDPELGAIARDALGTPGLQKAAVGALKKYPGPETAKALVDQLGKFPLKLRNEAINLLATRPEMALAMLKAVDAGELESSLVSPVMLAQFERFKNDEIDRIIENHWTRGTGGIDLAQLSQTIESWKKKLDPKVMAKADASRGRQTFTVTCGTCHQLFGEGIALGPDLTGSNRADLAYLLENVLAPSAVVGKDYLLNVLTLKDGSTVSGIIREETPEFVKVAMPGGSTTDVKLTDVAERQQLPQSLMVPGLFDALPLDQVADLVKYLASPTQVPLPGDKAATPEVDSSVPPPAKGITRIEGESLVPKSKPTGGNIKAQPMSNFGPGWSGNKHLWWTGGQPGDVLTLRMDGIAPGTHDVTLYTTTARDYGTIKVSINGQLRESDLYTEAVLPGEPLQFDNINVSPTEPLQIDIYITGKNPSAVPAYMVGIDRVEVSPVK
ncbi:MAG: VCBS repeat-containing protein, partial [Verrucomicrobiae bacterium]|nr:VCBS repeat-containing protein [Verrucomicrobiae bacterium]